MKYPTGNNSREDPALLVTAYVEEPNCLQILVEKLAGCNCQKNTQTQKMLPDWLMINTSSLEKLVRGHVIMATETTLFEMPFINCFLFTCITSAGTQYNLTWNCSLS